MKLAVIEARDLPEAWFLCVKETLANGFRYKIDQGSFAGQERVENDMIAIHVKYPGSMPMLPDTPQGIPQPCTLDYVENDYFPNYICGLSPTKKNETYTYGQFIQPQLQRVLANLQKSGYNTNQTHIRIGNDETDASTDPPCLRTIDIRVRYDAVHFAVYFRSWDLWAGFPANLAGLQLLKENVAYSLGLKDGELFAFSKGLHLYGYTLELAKQIISR